MRRLIGLPILVLLLLPASLQAQVPPPPDSDEVLSSSYSGKAYSPYAQRGFPTFPLWGDTHLHTANSMDAGAFGNRLDIDDAYRFARGEEVIASSGIPVKLSRPLDWLVVADHSDNMGFFPDLLAGNPELLADPTGKDWYDRINAGDGVNVALEIIGLFSQGEFPEAMMYTPDNPLYKNMWQKVIDTAPPLDSYALELK